MREIDNRWHCRRRVIAILSLPNARQRDRSCGQNLLSLPIQYGEDDGGDGEGKYEEECNTNAEEGAAEMRSPAAAISAVAAAIFDDGARRPTGSSPPSQFELRRVDALQ